MSEKSDKPEGSPPPEPRTEKPSEATQDIAASLVRQPRGIEIRSLVSSPPDILRPDVLPMDDGDPLPDGIRPGPGTGHTPSSEEEAPAPSSDDSPE
jgi:hypothetical protein